MQNKIDWIDKLTDLIEKEIEFCDTRPKNERGINSESFCYINDIIHLVETLIKCKHRGVKKRIKETVGLTSAPCYECGEMITIIKKNQPSN